MGPRVTAPRRTTSEGKATIGILPRWRSEFVNDATVLGEDDRGELWVPSRRRAEWWDRPFRRWKPTHWPAWWRSIRRGGVAFIELEVK